MGKILFFGGKGGVGKTSCSGAFAVAKAREGNKVLIISTDPAHSVSDLFETKIGDKIVKLKDNLYATEINPEKESEKYIENIRKSINKVYSVVIVEEINKQLDAAKVSPGSHEAALFDRMIEIINETSDDYDYIVFDTAPTGHTVRLLTLPSLLSSWIDTLLKKRKKTLMYREMYERDKTITEEDEIVKILSRRKKNLDTAKEILLDSGKLSFMFVLNAEKLAIDETRKATDILVKYNIPIGGYVVNRILPEVNENTDNGEFWASKKGQEKLHLKEIQSAFPNKTIYKIPLLIRDMGANEVEVMAENFMNN